jgi:hypothetical protein
MDQAASATCTIYVDGASSGSATNSAAWSWTAATPIELGRSHDGYWYKYNGLLDDVRFYNRLLTATEIGQVVTGADEPQSPGDIGLNVQAQMQGVNASAYLRVPFTLATPADVASLRLTHRWNDGFIAYVNGTQVAAQNAPASPAYNSTATGTHSGSIVDTYDFTPPGGLLRAGSNILAIQGLNLTAADAELSHAAEARRARRAHDHDGLHRHAHAGRGKLRVAHDHRALCHGGDAQSQSAPNWQRGEPTADDHRKRSRPRSARSLRRTRCSSNTW